MVISVSAIAAGAGRAHEPLPPSLISPTLTVAGPLKVIDGDTIAIGRHPIRLWAIDAPERAAPCPDPAGRERDCWTMARQALEEIIVRGGVPRCTAHGRDRYKRSVATCSGTRTGADYGALMLRAGYARRAAKYDAAGALRENERWAQRNGRGFWNCAAPTPARWRADKAKLCNAGNR